MDKLDLKKCLLVLALLLTGTPVMADVTNYCLNNNTIAFNFTVDSVGHNVTFPCSYGCDLSSGTCNPTPLMQNLLFIGIILAIIIIVPAGYWIVHKRD